jgi:aspartate/methionine/tyrosine aminotransferase
MQGLMLTAEFLVTPGDRVVAVEPGWPNIIGAFKATGADIASVAITPKGGHWALDVEELIAALTPGTKAVVINSPNNPTGWTMSVEEQHLVLEHCRRHCIWIVADDVYSRLYRHGRHAPSFLSIAETEDQLISVNSFSKCWSMTGWRLGWIVAPAAFEAKLGQLTEFNTSCTAGFVQEAGIAALGDGEEEIASLLSKIQAGYEITTDRLNTFSRVEFIEPDGAFYCFFRVDGLTDSFAAAGEILEQTKVGLAPGVAFGPQGEGYLRLCYAQPADVLEEAFVRLESFLSK